MAKQAKIWGIIPAAGIGTRFQKSTPKQYLSLLGQPIIHYSINLLASIPNMQEIVVSLSSKDKYWKDLPKTNAQIKTTEGGETRIHSVYNALQCLEDQAGSDDWVVIHDSVRPLTQPSDVEMLLDRIQDHPVGGSLGQPIVDTVKYVSTPETIDHTINRDNVWRIFTPQIFRYSALKSALKQAIAKGFLATDESGALEVIGMNPLIIASKTPNIKITHPDDLPLAEFHLKQLGIEQPLNLIPDSKRPKHIAIIMDGNGRWAQQNGMLRIQGHRAGFKAVRKLIEHAINQNIEVLTLFAFSSENWQRPQQEVDKLMQLFTFALNHETQQLHKNNVQAKFIGNKQSFDKGMQKKMHAAEVLTCQNTGLKLRIAANYGGRWDIVNAVQQYHLAQSDSEAPELITEADFNQYLSLSDVPAPDLFIRTGNEMRISNFLLWQLAYTELYFTEKLWPEFTPEELDKAMMNYAKRNRRYGKTREQVNAEA